MKFAIVSRPDEDSIKLAKTFSEKIMEIAGIIDEERPELVVSIGGDGTLLHAFHKYNHLLEEVMFVGIHTGHLGFYADWNIEEVDKLVALIAECNPILVEYPLLDMKITFNSGEVGEYLALNEATIHSVSRILQIEVEVQGTQFESFRGDGLCFSTPSGSTAYNKALGGAVIHPTLPAMQMAEIASINNRVFRTIGSPVILPSHHVCVLHPIKDSEFRFSLDHKEFVKEKVSRVEFSVSHKKIRFARYRKFPFWKRVHDSFIAD